MSLRGLLRLRSPLCRVTFVPVLLSSCLSANACNAQTPDASVQDALRSLHARAAVVYRGQVVRVERRGDVVHITFAVDEWLKGGVGAAFTLREWAGLWLSDPRRWLPGQAAVVFLHAPGAGGLASPVDGMDGVLPVVGSTGITAGDTVPAACVERLRTRVRRAIGTALPGSGEPLTMASLRTLIASGDGAQAPGLHPVLTPAPATLPAGGIAQRDAAEALPVRSWEDHAVQ